MESMQRRHITHCKALTCITGHLGEKPDNGAEVLFYTKPKLMKHVNPKIQKVV